MIIKISNYRAPSRNLTVRKHWAYYQKQRQEASQLVLAALRGKMKPFQELVDVEIISFYKSRLIDTANLDDKIWTDALMDVGVLENDDTKHLRWVKKLSCRGKENSVQIVVTPI